MGRKTRKFIDKKRDVIHTFKVVQRSQKDPLLVDETAPQGVLVDVPTSESHQEELQNYGIYFDDDYDYLQHLRGVKEAVDWEQEDVEVYTIRKVDPKQDQSTQNSGRLFLPSSVFESYIEEPIGLLNRAAPITGPRPELDPDIVAELDSDGSFEDCDTYDPEDPSGLPDNFVSLLNSEEPEVENGPEKGEEFRDIEQWLLGATDHHHTSPAGETSQWNGMTLERDDFSREGYSNEADDSSDCSSHHALFISDEERDDVGSLRDAPILRRRAATEATSRTSASSATVPRTELLSLLDEKFDRLYNEEYTDEKIGALDGEVIEGPFDVNNDVFQQAIASTKKQFERNLFVDSHNHDRDKTVRWVRESMWTNDAEAEEEENEMAEIEVKSKKNPYDCESIISTYSTTQNRPHLIDDSILSKKRRPKLTYKALKKHNEEEGNMDPSSDKDGDTVTLMSCINAISLRPKDETREDRRERKNALKELRRERRMEKKLNQIAFKEEMKMQKKISVNKPRNRTVAVV